VARVTLCAGCYTDREEHAISSEIFVIFALVLANGVLAGAEIAIVTLRRTRIRELVERGSGAARAVEALRDQPERFFATVQIGITVVGTTAGAFAGAAIAEDLEPWVARVPQLAPHAEEISIGLVVSLVSYLSLVLGELVPKSLALKASERYALLIARPLVWLSRAARPLVWFLTVSSNAVLRLFGDRTSFMEGRVSSEELQEMVGEATRAGTLHPDAGEIASRALEFQELVAADVMVPRTQVVALRRDASPEEIRATLQGRSHSRFPIYEGDIDHVVGYLHLKDLLAVAWEEKAFVLDDLLRPAYFVPDSKQAVELLAVMRGERIPLAIVVDERGSMAGIVTLEDLVEEVVGEIFNASLTDR
jgi:putative hemolysin